jgi:hypothetical protein
MIRAATSAGASNGSMWPASSTTADSPPTAAASALAFDSGTNRSSSPTTAITGRSPATVSAASRSYRSTAGRNSATVSGQCAHTMSAVRSTSS